jgi:hypothetical protein
MAQKIREKNQQAFNFACQRGIDVEELIRVYGIRFTLRLIQYLTKKPKQRTRLTELIYPRFKSWPALKNEAIQKYLDILEDAGFKLKSWREPFIDEDTGEIVYVTRWKIHYFNKQA